MLPVTVGLVGFSHAAAPDMLFSAFLAATAAAAAEMLEEPRAGMLAQAAFGISLGAAALAKGPAAVLLAGGAVLLWALLSRGLVSVLRFFHPVCLASFAAIAVPWYAICAARNPEFFRVFFIEHNFQRYLTPVFQHPQPVWFFLPVSCLAIFPWTALLLPLGLDALRARKSGRWRHSPTLFFACWAFAPLAFFSFSESKLPGYILPSVPPLVLILAWTLAKRLSLNGPVRVWTALVASAFPALSLVAVYWLGRLPPDSGLATASAWQSLLGTASVGGLICVLLAWARRERAAVAGTSVLTAVLVLAASFSVLPTLDPYLSARAAAHITAGEPGAAALVSILGVDRPLQFGLEYYLDRSVPMWIENSTNVWVWTTAKQVTDLQQRGVRLTVVRTLPPDLWLVRMEQPPGS
jgi:4-amino-4-deoxy-L-arabinose transferase-like glycosyltransferase